MAERRMFSKKIINTAKFLKMPATTQLLYFHLGLNADDDGVVEAFTVMRTSGGSEDDLKLLIAKQFIFLLNDDMVAFVCDWLEHNQIRSDRKTNSIYKNLLLSVDSNVKLIEPRQRTDSKKLVNQRTADGRPDVNQRTADGQHRVGKDRVGEDRVDEYISENTKKEKINKYGNYKWIKLTDAQYQKLIKDFDQEVIDERINFIDEYVQSTNNKNKYKDWNLVIRKSIKENWGNKIQSQSITNQILQKKSKFCNFEQREWDYEKIERLEIAKNDAYVKNLKNTSEKS